MTTETAIPGAISRVIEIGSLGHAQAGHVLEPTETELAAIAQRLDIPALKYLRGEFMVTPTRAGVDIVLKLSAEAERICVASLEPLIEAVREEIRMAFDRNYVDDGTVDFAAGDTLHEPLTGDQIDIGELLVQHLSLSLAPFPRKPGAESLAEKYRDAALSSPFSTLKGIVDRET